jgi:hypothetical protein
MMIGDTTVGKTSLLVRYADDDFNESVLATIGIDFKIKVRPASAAQSSAAQSHMPRPPAAPLADHRARWQADQASDLGYRRPGARRASPRD